MNSAKYDPHTHPTMQGAPTQALQAPAGAHLSGHPAQLPPSDQTITRTTSLTPSEKEALDQTGFFNYGKLLRPRGKYICECTPSLFLCHLSSSNGLDIDIILVIVLIVAILVTVCNFHLELLENRID